MKRVTWMIFAILLLQQKCQPNDACGRAEYSIDGECCPMCSPGMVVSRHCQFDSSTSCRPCLSGTFMNKPNGLTKCVPCKICGSEQGLIIHTECTAVHNTVCDVKDGYYCQNADSVCSFALKHTDCTTGQQTKEPGTKRTDSVCEDCQHGYYSQQGVNCTAWTDCAVKGQVKAEDGNLKKDVVCKNPPPPPPPRSHLILILPLFLIFTIIIARLCVHFRHETEKRKKEKESFMISRAVQETGHCQDRGNHTEEAAETSPGLQLTET